MYIWHQLDNIFVIKKCKLSDKIIIRMLIISIAMFISVYEWIYLINKLEKNQDYYKVHLKLEKKNF